MVLCGVLIVTNCDAALPGAPGVSTGSVSIDSPTATNIVNGEVGKTGGSGNTNGAASGDGGKSQSKPGNTGSTTSGTTPGNSGTNTGTTTSGNTGGNAIVNNGNGNSPSPGINPTSGAVNSAPTQSSAGNNQKNDATSINPKNAASPVTVTAGGDKPVETTVLPSKAQITADNNNPLPSLPANPYAGTNGTMSWQQCIDYGKYCRDVLCAFQNYTATCKGAGGCTCVGGIYSKAEPAPVFNINRLYAGPILIITIFSIIFGIVY
ncbi:hypothetical protein G9A89_015933 [Geosiphon pyriformis]|nr:hypothetical protein G9A89_015933 [Geosiphon pyriformis]